MKWPLPLRFSIPLILLLFAFAAGMLSMRYGRALDERQLEDRFRERAASTGTRLAAMSAYFIEMATFTAGQRAVALTGMDRDVRFAVVVDDKNRVIFSTRYEQMNRPIENTAVSGYLPFIEKARASREGQIEMAPDRNTLRAAYPYAVTPREGGALRDTNLGVVLIEFDLAERRAAMAATAMRRLQLAGLVMLGLTLVFWLLFKPMLTSRVERLAKAARQLAAGNPSARAGLSGGDELAELARAFDQMAADLQRGSSELRESETRFRFLVEGIPQIVWLLELEPPRVLYVSPAFERIWGRTSADLYADASVWMDAIHEEDRPRARTAFADWLAGRVETHDVTYRIVRPDASQRWIRDRVGRLEAAPNGRLRIIGLAEDITAQRENETNREDLERKLQETQKLESLGVLAGGIAHDFNNLLTGILGNAALARQELGPASPAQPHLEQIEAVTVRAGELCKQMLAYSGKGRFQVQRLDLSALVRETTQLVQLSIDKTAVLRFNLAESLPPIEADATQLRQVVMNLVINASEALGGKSGVIAINTGLVRLDRDYIDQTVLSPELPEGDYAYLEVSDTGCGMNAEQQGRIFEPFFTTKFTGRGLGLSAVLGIVRGHRGALRVYSEAGKGTTFKVIFPTAAGEPEPLAHETTEAAWNGAGAVLVVDDEQTVRTVAARMVEKFGFTAITASNGREGIEKFLAHRGEIVAVLMDLTMPHLDGENTFRELRAIDPDVRVVLMSGFNEQDAINRFTGKGLAGFVQKPFRPDTLRRKLKEALEDPSHRPPAE